MTAYYIETLSQYKVLFYCKRIYIYLSNGRRSGKCLLMSTNARSSQLHIKRVPYKLATFYTASNLYWSISLNIWVLQSILNYHSTSICKRANSVLGFLRRNFDNSPRKVKADLYLIYIKPILEYTLPVWSPHTRCLINKLESVQRRAARFVMSDYYLTSSVSAMLHCMPGMEYNRVSS